MIGTFIADLVLQILSYVSETERVTTKQRQREGIEAAKLKGVLFGRPSKDYPDDWEKRVKKFESGEMTVIKVAEICNITTTTSSTADVKNEKRYWKWDIRISAKPIVLWYERLLRIVYLMWRIKMYGFIQKNLVFIKNMPI